MHGRVMGVDPVRVRGGGTKLGIAEGDLNAVLKKLTAALEAEGECWGHDETGQQFAQNYVPGKDSTVAALGKVTAVLGTCMTNLRQTADDLEGRDRRTASRFGRLQRG